MPKHDLRRIGDLTLEDVRAVFDLAATLKAELKRRALRPLLAGRSVAMLFEKPSLRTRATFDLGAAQLGAHPISFTGAEVGLGRRESIPDVARNLERWVDLVVMRTFAQSNVDQLAAHCSKPVINALSDYEHPCQALADFFTLNEHFGSLDSLRVAYVGDGNNVTHSLLLLGALLGVEMRVATPDGYAPAAAVVEQARRTHPRGAAGVWTGHDPLECVRGCDAVYTDVWASMGQEHEAAERARAFAGYQVNSALLARAKPGAKVMHCLPAHRGEEISDDAMDSPHSIVFDQAENRLHVQKAVMAYLFERSR
ncbi:MAG: ornithine carbamoyltransferase [Candidatus Sumerlaeota bacterium]|nr:ornithine carbamoyltransferase [Candidatus Sumerlaeota bacterium]